MFGLLASTETLSEASANLFGISNERINEVASFISSSRRLRKTSIHWGQKLFFDYLKSKKNVGILEVGSNDCAHTQKFLAELENNVFAMELNPHSFKYLIEVKNTFKERFNFIMAGASNETKVVTFPVFSSFRGKGLEEMSGITGVEARTDMSQLEVSYNMLSSTIRIQELFENNFLPERNAVWIDVEGHALEVLEGIGTKYLRKCDLIYVEVETEKFFENGPSAEKVFQYLTQRNFSLIFRDFQTYGQFNLIFKNNASEVTVEDDVKNYMKDVGLLKLTN